jgi:predicted aspartyl protease
MVVCADIELIRGVDLALVREGYRFEDQIRRCTISAIVACHTTMLAIPEFVRKQLDLSKVSDIEAELADGSSGAFEVVGSIKVRFQNRRTSVEALVIPDSTKLLLGAIPMEGLDVLIDPKRERLIVNPESLDVARMRT